MAPGVSLGPQESPKAAVEKPCSIGSFGHDYACTRHQKRRQEVYWGFTFVQGAMTF